MYENMPLKTIIGTLVLLLGTWLHAAQPYGFGKVVKLGKHDHLVHHESLRVLTSEVVGFVHYQQGRSMDGSMNDPSNFRILEDGKPMIGHKILGRFVKLHHMGHVPEPYLPATLIGTTYVKLPKPMVEGKVYAFKSKDIGTKAVNLSLKWSTKTVLSDAIKVNQIGYLPDTRIRLAYVGKWLGTGGALDPKIDEFHVIDLETGDQPISATGPDGNEAVLVANGEIYNHVEVRLDLSRAPFKTRSDCEVPLQLYLREDLAFTEHLRGMYAIAIHDRANGRLVLARDPFGIKPLYVAQSGAAFAFASEPQALIRAGLATARLNPAAISPTTRESAMT